MIELQDGMLLYHGSYIGIPAIDLNRCFGGLDFGRGFYLTSSYEQAYNYVQLSVRKAMRIGTVPKDFNLEDGQISVYKFHYDPNILAYCCKVWAVWSSAIFPPMMSMVPYFFKSCGNKSFFRFAATK